MIKKQQSKKEDFKFNIEEPNRLIVQYFGGNEIIRKSDLFDRFNGKVWVDNDDDAIKFEILYFIHMFVYSGEKRIISINKVLTTDGQYYRICGMPVVLQIWIYECMGKRQTNFARKISDCIPRILNWQRIGEKSRFKTLTKDTFNDGNREIKWKNVVPSLMEIDVLQLPPEGVEKSTEGVQTVPHHDIDEQALSGQNSDDDFVNPPPPSMKVREEFKDIRKLINDNFNIIMSTLKVDCDNFPVRNLINVDAGFSSSKSIIPSDGMESQNKKSHVHTPLPGHRIRRPGPFNTSPYMTSFGSSAGHDAAIRKEVIKWAQLIPLKLTMYDYYKNRGLDRSVSQEENELFEIVFIDNIPQQTDGSLIVVSICLLLPSGCLMVKEIQVQKQDNGAISDSEAPPRHTMPQYVRVVSAPIEIQ
uniref:DUF1985 domain-containing protein n=1 Tax=Solanum lycopersicum TaxID=4081 RepID=A0A3Q7IW45_SOLLC